MQIRLGLVAVRATMASPWLYEEFPSGPNSVSASGPQITWCMFKRKKKKKRHPAGAPTSGQSLGLDHNRQNCFRAFNAADLLPLLIDEVAVI